VGRLTLLALIGLAVLACAACGGGSKQAAGRSHALPSPLIQQIRAELQKPSIIGGASSAKSVEVYGPASHGALERASSGSMSGSLHVAGAWYLIVLRGRFAGNFPVPPGAKQPHARIAMEVWSPKGNVGRAFSFANRLPAAVSRLHGPTAIDLS
jgi:hypothetical protein